VAKEEQLAKIVRIFVKKCHLLFTLEATCPSLRTDGWTTLNGISRQHQLSPMLFIIGISSTNSTGPAMNLAGLRLNHVFGSVNAGVRNLKVTPT